MSRLAIRADRLCKEFQIGRQERYGRLSELLIRAGRSALLAPASLLRKSSEEVARFRPESTLFTALNDVSFDVREGEVVGLIGSNGAGKSTLLKVLSRITEPTSGRFGVRGRVGSLLEVGTGFHPELTGRENISLCGAILGMSPAEVKRHFDEIVEFAGVEEFLDTPVKRYSSGMYVRLGFAVAAHLKPEILVIDEVLAVGDLEFQQKCLRRLGGEAESGRTILFVSHNLSAIRDLCSRVIVLDGGAVLFDGDVETGIACYTSRYSTENQRRVNFEPVSGREMSLLTAELLTPETPDGRLPCRGEALQVRLEYSVASDLRGTNLALRLNRDGQTIFTSFDLDRNPDVWKRRQAGRHTVTVALPSDLLKSGFYTIDFGAGRVGTEIIDRRHNALQFELADPPDDAGDSRLRGYARERAGCLALALDWLETESRPIDSPLLLGRAG